MTIQSKAKPKLVCVDPEHVQNIWPAVKHLIDAATAKCGDWTTEDVKGVIDAGGLLWVSINNSEILMAAVSRLIKTRGALVCEMVACGGADDDWQDRIRPVEEYAKREGCDRIRVAGRKGWSRIFTDYCLKLVVLEKEL